MRPDGSGHRGSAFRGGPCRHPGGHKEFQAPTYIVGKRARPHKALASWHARTLSFGNFEFLRGGPLDATKFGVYCAKCSDIDGEEAEELAPPSSYSDGTSSWG